MISDKSDENHNSANQDINQYKDKDKDKDKDKNKNGML
jgi:hypothetical protein